MFDVSNNAIKRIEEVSLKDNKKKFFRISVDGGGVRVSPISLILTKI